MACLLGIILRRSLCLILPNFLVFSPPFPNRTKIPPHANPQNRFKGQWKRTKGRFGARNSSRVEAYFNEPTRRFHVRRQTVARAGSKMLQKKLLCSFSPWLIENAGQGKKCIPAQIADFSFFWGGRRRKDFWFGDRQKSKGYAHGPDENGFSLWYTVLLLSLLPQSIGGIISAEIYISLSSIQIWKGKKGGKIWGVAMDKLTNMASSFLIWLLTNVNMASKFRRH